MARRPGPTSRTVEEKRQSLPIYQHYTLSPGKTKSHHPEAKCKHCLKEFVCGSKQRLIRHLRRCNSISNPEQIIADTLNTLARNSATGQLNHSILAASNLLPPHSVTHHQNSIHHVNSSQNHIIATQANQAPANHLYDQFQNPTASTNSMVVSSATANVASANSCNATISQDSNAANLSTNAPCGEISGFNLTNNSSNGSHHSVSPATGGNTSKSAKKSGLKRGRKPASSNGPAFHVVTGLDGKPHYAPASQLPHNISRNITATTIATGGQIGFAYLSSSVQGNSNPSANTPGNVTCATASNHLHSLAYKLNSEYIDKAYLKLVLTRNLPLSLCDTKEFQSWVKTFASDYKPPTSINLIDQNLKNEAQAARQRTTNILVKALKKTVNLELHGWLDEVRERYWFAVIANHDHKRFLITLRDLFPSGGLLSSNVLSEKSLVDLIYESIRRVGSDRTNSLLIPQLSFLDQDYIAKARELIYASHPSIVTYDCWWHFTNLLCSDVIENNSNFKNLLRKSKQLISYLIKHPKIALTLDKYSPFVGVAESILPRSKDPRWFSHLVCYSLAYIQKNQEAIVRAIQVTSTSSKQSHLTSDDNNNDSSRRSINDDGTRPIGVTRVHHNSSATMSTQLPTQTMSYEIDTIESIVTSSDFWADLNMLLSHLKPFQDIIALSSSLPCGTSSSTPTPNDNQSPQAISTIANYMTLSDYAYWFLNYGHTLLDLWHQSPSVYKYSLLSSFFKRFDSFKSQFKLLFAAYLLNPKYRCAYMTQRAKDVAIEEILNIASEFMPEESDGRTIYDQWKLFLIREEPYDVPYEENRSTSLEWWMSLPCAESIRRVALRILRLKSFTLPKSDSLFSQLYFYEDEIRSSLRSSAFEDVATLRYFYDFEDKVLQGNFTLPVNNTQSQSSGVSSHSITINLPSATPNGHPDRAQSGQLHSEFSNQIDYSKIVPSNSLENGLNESGKTSDESRLSFSNSSFPDAIVESYMNHSHHIDSDTQDDFSSSMIPSLSSLSGYDLFIEFIDYNLPGVQVIEEPIEKKRRKWTAQEIINPKPKSQNNDTVSRK